MYGRRHAQWVGAKAVNAFFRFVALEWSGARADSFTLRRRSDKAGA
jgi:hypothetical protein